MGSRILERMLSRHNGQTRTAPESPPDGLSAHPKHSAFAPTLAVFLLVVAIQFLQLQVSCSWPSCWALWQPDIILLCLGITAIPTAICLLISRRLWVAVIIAAVLVTLVAIANCYTIDLHKAPLCLSELRNIGAAFAVIGGYSPGLGPRAMAVLAGFALQVLVVILLYRRRNSTFGKISPKTLVITLTLLVIDVLLVWLLAISSEFNIGVLYNITWSRIETANTYGYPSFIIADAYTTTSPLLKPNHYDTKLVDSALRNEAEDAQGSSGKIAARQEYPDIIVVVNETFYDLADYTNLETVEPFLEGYYTIDGATYGHAFVPSLGGGTNNTEFEVLTSHSLKLLRVTAPFNFIDFTKANDSTVRLLESLGYRTSAFHIGGPQNYRRNIAYPEMGFDEVALGPDAFPEQVHYGKRHWQDSGCYARVLQSYDENPPQPQFLYLLTYQNHGGWDQNGSEYDTIHSTGDYNIPPDEIDEFLTSVSQSGDAFSDFIDSLRESDRDTVVVMLGDHAPSFVSELPFREDAPYPNEDIGREVPLVIWSNFEMDTSDFDGTVVQATDIMPLLLQACDMPSSPYYRAIARIAHSYNVRTSIDDYIDAEGHYGSSSEDETFKEMMDVYQTMEYNALSHGSDYRADWFDVVR